MPPLWKRIIPLVAGVLSGLAALYCVLWMIGSASLACTACDCHYSLFAATFRCRQPPLAGLLAIVFAGLAIWAGRVAWRNPL